MQKEIVQQKIKYYIDNIKFPVQMISGIYHEHLAQ